MKRILTVLAVALVVVAMVVVTAAPAFAAHHVVNQNGKEIPGQNPCDNPCKDIPNGLDRSNGAP